MSCALAKNCVPERGQIRRPSPATLALGFCVAISPPRDIHRQVQWRDSNRVGYSDVRQLTTVAERVNRTVQTPNLLATSRTLSRHSTAPETAKKFGGQQGDKILVKHAASLQAVGLGAGIYPEGKRRLGIG